MLSALGVVVQLDAGLLIVLGDDRVEAQVGIDRVGRPAIVVADRGEPGHDCVHRRLRQGAADTVIVVDLLAVRIGHVREPQVGRQTLISPAGGAPSS